MHHRAARAACGDNPSMVSWMAIAQLVLLGLAVVLLFWLVLRRADSAGADKLERNLRGDVQDSARGTRQELAQNLAAMQQALLAQSGDVARTQNEQIDSFRTQLAAMQQQISQSLQQSAAQGVQQAQARIRSQHLEEARQL